MATEITLVTILIGINYWLISLPAHKVKHTTQFTTYAVNMHPVGIAPLLYIHRRGKGEITPSELIEKIPSLHLPVAVEP